MLLQHKWRQTAKLQPLRGLGLVVQLMQIFTTVHIFRSGLLTSLLHTKHIASTSSLANRGRLISTLLCVVKQRGTPAFSGCGFCLKNKCKVTTEGHGLGKVCRCCVTLHAHKKQDKHKCSTHRKATERRFRFLPTADKFNFTCTAYWLKTFKINITIIATGGEHAVNL